MQVADPEPVLQQVLGQVLGHLLGQGRDQHPLVALGALAHLVHEVVDLVLGLAHLDRGIDDAGRAHDLLDRLEGLRALPGTGGGRDQHHLADAVEETVELERAVVDRRGSRNPEVDQGRLAREVALIHAADLGDRLVRLVDEGDELVGEVVDQRVRRVARGRRTPPRPCSAWS